MIFSIQPILDSLPVSLQSWLQSSFQGVDPLVFLAPVCFGLGVSAIALLAELEKVRVRWCESAMKRRLLESPSRVASRRPPSDRRN